MAVMIRWRRKGIFFRDGLAYEREAGDHDMVEQREATNRSRQGEVEIVAAAVPVVHPEPIHAETRELSGTRMEGRNDELDHPGDRQGVPSD